VGKLPRALAKRLPRNGRSAWDDTSVRQRVAQFAMEVEAIKYTGLRNLTRQLKGLPPGPEGSILKLTGTEIGVRIADAAGTDTVSQHNLSALA